MRKTRAITLTVLSGLMLTACCVTSVGCGRRPAPDHTWYDASGNRIEERWKTDEHGNRVVDAEGRPIPDPHVPYDNYGRPWAYTNGVWAPLAPPLGHTRTGSSWWYSGGSGYRSTSGSSYHPAAGPSSSSSSRSGPSSSPSSVSRGGFGSTGAGTSGS